MESESVFTFPIFLIEEKGGSLGARPKHFLREEVDSLKRKKYHQTSQDRDFGLWSGYTGEAFVHHLLHMIPPSFEDWKPARWHNGCDVKTAAFIIEVKMMSVRDMIKYRMRQLEHQIVGTEFNAETESKAIRLLCIITYHNHKIRNGQRIRALSRSNITSLQEFQQFVFDNLKSVHVIDISLAEAVSQKRGARIDKRYRYGSEEMVPLHREDLVRIAEDTATELRKLGYEEELIARWVPPGAKRILPRTIVTEFAGKKRTFPLHALTDVSTRREFFRKLNGQVRREERTHKPQP